MSVTNKRGTWIMVGTLWALGSGIPAFADDTELFLSNSGQFASTALPNVLFILDTSGSMGTEVTTQSVYDPAITYNGTCDRTRVYWIRNTGNPNPSSTCGSPQWFNRTAYMCDAHMSNGLGFYTDLMAQYDSGSDNRWEWLLSNVNDKSYVVECATDYGNHGDGTSGIALWASDDQAGQPWINDVSKGVPWGSNQTDRTYTTFDGNYVNWYNGGGTQNLTRLQVMKNVVTNLLLTLDGINVGLMRFNYDAGGPVVVAIEDIATGRQTMIDAINVLPSSGYTPLSEALYEAGQYYAGRSVDYGNQQGPPNSVAQSRTPGNANVYQTPIEYSCSRNFVVMLTDGVPVRDTGANSRITNLPDFDTLVGNNCDGGGEGACLDDMAEYLFYKDLNPNIPGLQNVTTYTVGFTIDLPLLASTALRGGGEYMLADDTSSLALALKQIVTQILRYNTTFTAPSVAVNSFNRTRNANDMFMSLFEASGSVHWPGNLKKYRLRPSDGAIMDANGRNAVDPVTGFFADTAQSFWSPSVDGSQTVFGGAANLLPDSGMGMGVGGGMGLRKVYTYLGGNPDLTAAANNVVTGNASIDEMLLGIAPGGVGMGMGGGDPSRNDLIAFIRGFDVTDVDNDGIITEERYEMGDPLHSQPATITYGGTLASPDINDGVIYFATNDGYLHAIDPVTGVEKWAFIPPEFMGDQVDLFNNNAIPIRHYGIDGSLMLQVLDNDNGIVEPGAGDKVYLFFGMRRGGDFYYGLDVTDPDTPTLMWTMDGTTLPGAGQQSWSSPQGARIDIQGAAQNAEKMVLIFGGGYDLTQDNAAASTDTNGNAIYIVDSVSGALLWHASQNGANRNLTDMQYSIPGNVRVIDLDGDKFADRMYASDMGGQVWRLDVFNGQPAGNLITGGVIAQLGGAPQGAPPLAATRRMYYAPDIALVNDDNNNFLHIGVGSGHRASPSSVVNQDRFYALRDYDVFRTRTQGDYASATPIVDADLVDVTNDINAVVPLGSPGWRYELRNGGWQGEKVLAESRTFDNKVYFTTFTPSTNVVVNNCQPALGTNRLYVVDLFNGAPVNNMDGVGDPNNLTDTDRYREYRGSISSEVVFLFPSPDDPANCVGDQCTPPPVACVDLFCFQTGFANNPARTFWSEEAVQ